MNRICEQCGVGPYTTIGAWDNHLLCHEDAERALGAEREAKKRLVVNTKTRSWQEVASRKAATAIMGLREHDNIDDPPTDEYMYLEYTGPIWCIKAGWEGDEYYWCFDSFSHPSDFTRIFEGFLVDLTERPSVLNGPVAPVDIEF